MPTRCTGRPCRPAIFVTAGLELKPQEILRRPFALHCQDALGVELHPWIGNSRCRKPMISPSAVRALGTRHTGTLWVARRANGNVSPRTDSATPRTPRRRRAGSAKFCRASAARRARPRRRTPRRSPGAPGTRRAPGCGARVADDVFADPRILRLARPGRDADALGFQRGEFLDGDLIVATHGRFRAEFAEILDEVVRERVVVIEDEEHRRMFTPGMAAQAGATS